MDEYRLLFLDNCGRIKAEHKFFAEDDKTADELGGLVWTAGSDVFAGYELWSPDRRITWAPHGRPTPSVDQVSIEMQFRVLELENLILQSRRRAAKSKKMLESRDALRYSLNEQLTRHLKPGLSRL